MNDYIFYAMSPDGIRAELARMEETSSIDDVNYNRDLFSRICEKKGLVCILFRSNDPLH